MSDTPIVDSWDLYDSCGYKLTDKRIQAVERRVEYCEANKARNLERDLVAANAEIAALKEAGRWRKASEPPNDDRLVLVSTASYVVIGWFINGIWMRNGDTFAGEVTGWMERPKPHRPQPPKEGEQQ